MKEQFIYYLGYKGNIKVCFHRNVLYGSVLEFQSKPMEDSVSYYGDSPQALLADFHSIIDRYNKVINFVPN